jgi:hypothetical protein
LRVRIACELAESHVNSNTRVMRTTWENEQCQKVCVYVHSLKQLAPHVLQISTPKHNKHIHAYAHAYLGRLRIDDHTR